MYCICNINSEYYMTKISLLFSQKSFKSAQSYPLSYTLIFAMYPLNDGWNPDFGRFQQKIWNKLIVICLIRSICFSSTHTKHAISIIDSYYNINQYEYLYRFNFIASLCKLGCLIDMFEQQNSKTWLVICLQCLIRFS